MGFYLCIASNGVPPSISKRYYVKVLCELTGIRWDGCLSTPLHRCDIFFIIIDTARKTMLFTTGFFIFCNGLLLFGFYDSFLYFRPFHPALFNNNTQKNVANDFFLKLGFLDDASNTLLTPDKLNRKNTNNKSRSPPFSRKSDSQKSGDKTSMTRGIKRPDQIMSTKCKSFVL